MAQARRRRRPPDRPPRPPSSPGAAGRFVKANPVATMRVIVGQEVGGHDGLHFLARARLGRAQAEKLAEGFVIHIFGQDQPGGGGGRFLRVNLGLFHRQRDRVHDGRSHARPHGHGQERIVDAMAVGQPEGDVGSPAGGVHAQLLAQTAHQG